MQLAPRFVSRRKLHRGHFAFMRAVVQGLPLRDSWDRYLRVEGEHTDVRTVRATIAWIRDEFAAAARRERRHGAARLVLIDAASIEDRASPAPSLEDFAYTRGLEDFSEAEQLAAYTAEYGTTTSKQGRRARVVQQQLDALQWLESLIAEPPRASDAVSAWLHPQLAIKLEHAGLSTLGDLVERINGIGLRWAKNVRGVGAIKAERIVDWLRDHEANLECRLGDHVAQARSRLDLTTLDTVVECATAIRPLEKFRAPPELDGRDGRYRCPPAQCLLAASNDYEAILAWLRAKPGLTPQQAAARRARKRTRQAIDTNEPLAWLETLSHTQRAYRKEAERFLLWAILVRGKALSSMSQEDCVAYREFLADPQPSAQWCGIRVHERWSPAWRPFEGPLSTAAQRQAIVILRNLYAFLANQNYLMGNPWTGVAIPISATPRINAGRSFNKGQWSFVEQQLAELPADSISTRLRVALNLLYATGLRLAEIVSARVDDLQWVEYPPDDDDITPLDGWMLRVVGKGQRLREVPVPNDIVDAIGTYLEERGLSPDMASPSNRGAYLLGKSSDWARKVPQLAAGKPEIAPREGIAASTLALQLKRFFQQCGRKLEASGDIKAALRFERASTHWMRHTHASHAIARGMPIEIAQQNLGHASLATTTIYVTTEKKRRLRAAKNFWENLPPKS